MTLLECIITGIFALAVALVEMRAARDRKRELKETERTEKRAARRAEESLLSMELMNANCKLAVVTAKALTNQTLNGDVGEAMIASQIAQKRYDDYIKKEAASQTAKL